MTRHTTIDNFDFDSALYDHSELHTRLQAAVEVDSSASDYVEYQADDGSIGYAHSLFGSVSGTWSASAEAEEFFCQDFGTILTTQFAADNEDDGYFAPAFTTMSSSTDPSKGFHVIGPMWLILGNASDDSGFCWGVWPNPNGDMGPGFGAFSVEQPGTARSKTATLLKLPTSGGRGPEKLPNGSLHWKGSQTYTYRDGEDESDEFYSHIDDDAATWTYDLTLTPSGGLGCQIQAADPQRARSGKLVIKVLGRDKGCKADLTRTKLQIGKRIFSSVRKLPARQVGNGKTVSFEVPYGKATLKRIKTALKKKTRVRAKAEFTIDGKADSVIVRVK